jgi:hypothetical protein
VISRVITAIVRLTTSISLQRGKSTGRSATSAFTAKARSNMDAQVLPEDIEVVRSLKGKPIPEGSSLGAEYVKARTPAPRGSNGRCPSRRDGVESEGSTEPIRKATRSPVFVWFLEAK